MSLAEATPQFDFQASIGELGHHVRQTNISAEKRQELLSFVFYLGVETYHLPISDVIHSLITEWKERKDIMPAARIYEKSLRTLDERNNFLAELRRQLKQTAHR